MTKPVTQFTQDGKLPPSLHEYPYFCLWRYELNDKGTGYTKVPYQPRHPEWGAASTKKEDFADINTALAAATGFDGLGVGLFDNLCAIDIDHCIDDAGKLSKLAYNIIASMNSYTEYSPSGKGIRIFFYSSDPYDTERFYINRRDAKDDGEEWPQQQGLEIYCPGVTKKYVTITGNVQRKMNVEERGLELRAVLENYMERPTKQEPPTVAPRPSSLSDNEIITAATNEKGGKFKSLFYDGDISGYPSQSEADAALMSKLAFYTGGDEGRMVELFKQSALYGDIKRKGTARNQEKYLQRTAKSVSRQNEYYTPPTPKEERRPQPVEPQQAPETTLKICKASDYITAGTFDEDINYFKAYRHRKTGFPNIDKYLTLYPGLAALGGASSLGKTTFAVNLVDNLAKGDKDRDPETVLYFTLEQLPIELVTKSLARMMYEDGYKELRNTDIKNGATSDRLEYIKKMYAQKIGCRVHYISCDFRVTAADIISTVKQFMDANQVKPVVVVDYLQLIAPPAGFRGSLRECVDENLKALKAMQKENGLFVLLISSFNRNSNMEPVSYEAFKETSMIEFTCDFVWGLQLTVLDAENDGFYRKQTTGNKASTADSSVDNKRRMLTRARDAEVKEVEFVSLKSRNAKQVYTAFFQYRPEYDSYTPYDKDQKPDWNAINGEKPQRQYDTPNKA